MDITLLIALIGGFGSIITIFINKTYEKVTDMRKIKENQYIEFLSYLAKWVAAELDDKSKFSSELSAKVQNIYLVGNKSVQSALTDFLDYMDGKEKNIEMQDVLYANLIMQMKLDLYCHTIIKKKTSQSLERIRIRVFYN